MKLHTLQNIINVFRDLSETDDTSYWKGRSERDFEVDLQTVLYTAGIYAVKLSGLRSDVCLPDLICHMKADTGKTYSCYVECKLPGGKLQEEQALSFTGLEHFCDIFVVDSLPSAVEFFEHLLKVGSELQKVD